MESIISIPRCDAIIGLGNPGSQYYKTRHSIGYRIIDALAQRFGGIWRNRGDLQTCDITINYYAVVLVKSNTYMNDSGKVIPFLQKKGIEPSHILVIHDELEKPFNTLAFKIDGSHRGHNGLRSIMHVCGSNFARLRVGIGRPTDKNDVSEYVLQSFTHDEEQRIPAVIDKAVDMIEKIY